MKLCYGLYCDVNMRSRGKEERKGDGLIVIHLYICHIDKGSVVLVGVFNFKQHRVIWEEETSAEELYLAGRLVGTFLIDD